MKAFSIPLNVRIMRLDLSLVCAILSISTLSILTILSGIETFGASRFIIQLFAILLGTFIMLLFSFYDYE